MALPYLESDLVITAILLGSRAMSLAFSSLLLSVVKCDGQRITTCEGAGMFAAGWLESTLACDYSILVPDGHGRGTSHKTGDVFDLAMRSVSAK